MRYGVAWAAVAACIACGVLSQEEQLLTDFFEASRVYDVSVMARLSAKPMNPRVDGIVDSFDVERVDRGRDGMERVTVSARVRTFDGHQRSHQLVFTLARQNDRWFIRDWVGAP